MLMEAGVAFFHGPFRLVRQLVLENKSNQNQYFLFLRSYYYTTTVIPVTCHGVNLFKAEQTAGTVTGDGRMLEKGTSTEYLIECSS